MTDLRIIARCVLMLGGVAAGSVAMAQAMAPSAAASAAAERAQKETDRTMYWIRVLAATPAPKAAPAPALKPVAAAPAPAPAPQAKAPAPERVKVAAATPGVALVAANSADLANATPGPVVAAAPAAAAPSLASGHGNASAMTTAGLDAGVSSAGVAAGLAAPAATAAQVDIPPVDDEPDPGLIMVKSADPQFPVATMRRLRKGEVEVRFEVNPDGVVDSVTVVKTTNAGLNNAAMDAVKQWRFKPTPKGHTAAVELAFNLDA